MNKINFFIKIMISILTINSYSNNDSKLIQESHARNVRGILDQSELLQMVTHGNTAIANKRDIASWTQYINMRKKHLISILYCLNNSTLNLEELISAFNRSNEKSFQKLDDLSIKTLISKIDALIKKDKNLEQELRIVEKENDENEALQFDMEL